MLLYSNLAVVNTALLLYHYSGHACVANTAGDTVTSLPTCFPKLWEP
jgi:hypothetical protein